MTQAQLVRQLYFNDATVTDAEYGRMVEEAELRDLDAAQRAEGEEVAQRYEYHGEAA
jgi:hypothetical protein